MKKRKGSASRRSGEILSVDTYSLMGDPVSHCPFLSNPLLTQWLHFSEHRWVHSSERHSLDHGSEEVTDMPATIPSIFSSF